MVNRLPQSSDHSSSSPWANAFRDILIASINKGQFPLAIFWLIAMSLIWRIPPEDVSRLVFRIVDGLERWALLGYLLALVVTGGWFVHVRSLRRVISLELSRSFGAQRMKSSRG
ncbi:hypothetical protein [Peristeroidobacter soli]|jgi:hypothetical protein|uniref:hypothetical protein n=1 Tax=Peristeroidobacter soli TaxID=2497877 RepID=UPI00101BC9B4|nr:hypothetical protein [Peristeroidobacter soli]